MSEKLSRRHFLSSTIIAAGTAVATQQASAQAVPTGKIKVIALNGSPRKDKTTVAALTVAMEAAKAVAPDRIEVELVR